MKLNISTTNLNIFEPQILLNCNIFFFESPLKTFMGLLLSRSQILIVPSDELEQQILKFIYLEI